MDDNEFTTTLDRLGDHLTEATRADPLQVLTVIVVVQRDVDEHRREAVRAAARQHSWAEIGDALGVSKQAAHQKYAKEWARTLTEEVKVESGTFRTAMKKGELRLAADAKDKLDAVISELKQANTRRR